MVVLDSTYKAPKLFINGHLETILPALFRKISGVNYERERITTPDDDFLDLDWSRVGSDHLVIVSHGLEGNSTRAYMKGMVKLFNENGIDALAWNFRGCSEEMNRQLRFYHSGATEDLRHLIETVAANNSYQTINLVGFSLGGNLTLKFLGEEKTNLNSAVRSAAVFSVPIDLAASCKVISEPQNFLYSNRFLRNLKRKIRTKSKQMPGLNTNGLGKISNLKDFDDRYTAPLHGFKDAEQYYDACSAKHFIGDIVIPTLLVNARNDPFLSASCYPEGNTVENSNFYAEYPETGGHVGFPRKVGRLYWAEHRALEFVKKYAEVSPPAINRNSP